MKQTLEFGGKNIEAAIKKACAELDFSKDELEYDVISSGTTGIFGIVGRKEARIRVSVPENKQDDDVSDIDDHEMEGIHSIVDEAFGPETRKNKDARIFENPEPEEIEAVDVTEEAIELGIEALQKMVNLITDDATVSAEADKDKLTLKIDGGNAGILIGRKGQNLDAMQFLTDKMINRKSESRVRVKVDIEGYMETRKSNLKHLAQKMAEKAKKTGRPATINQMSAQDRRIVHLALKDDTRVRTQSMGEGYYRRLVIFPKKNNAFKGKRRLKK